MKKLLAVTLALAAALAVAATGIVQDQCGPFTDVSPAICPYVLEMYYLGITAGTSPTTYSPDATVTRGQAAVFVSKGVNQAIARSSRRAALGQWWTTRSSSAVAYTTGVGPLPFGLQSDGTDVWVADVSGTVSRIKASDGRVLESWTGPNGGLACVLVAAGKVWVTAYGDGVTGTLYSLDPKQPPGLLTVESSSIGVGPNGLAFDGSRVWTANYSGSVSIFDLETRTTTNVTGFQHPVSVLFDGKNMWLLDEGDFHKLDANGSVLQTVVVGPIGRVPGFRRPQHLAPGSCERQTG